MGEGSLATQPLGVVACNDQERRRVGPHAIEFHEARRCPLHEAPDLLPTVTDTSDFIGRSFH